MSSETEKCCDCKTKAAYALGILGAFLIVAALVWAMRHYTQAPALDGKRAEERAKALTELRADDVDKLNNVGWVDQARGVVRLRVEDAMQIVEREWKNPAAARSNLLARVEKATPPPPPPPPPPAGSEFQ